MTALLSPGFADPVRHAQATFRAVLDAMARPGQVYAVSAPVEPPHLLNRATAAVLLTLLDAETSLWLDPAAADLEAWLTFHCGSPLASIGQANFALALAAPPLATLFAGSDEEPETSATLILQVEDIGEGSAFRLTGPGLDGPGTVRVSGLSASFPAEWAANHRLFPRGIDLILCAGDKLAALPRTAALEPA